MEATKNVQTEAMEGANPQRSGSLGLCTCKALGHLCGRTIGECQQKDTARITPVRQQTLNSSNQRTCLPSARSGLKQICGSPVASGLSLRFVQRDIRGLLRARRRHAWQEQRIEHLLGHHFKRCTKLGCDRSTRHALVKVQLPDYRARQQELARKEIHLDFATLAMAIVNDPIQPYRSILTGARGFNRVWAFVIFVPVIITQLGMTNFMSYQECLLER